VTGKIKQLTELTELLEQVKALEAETSEAFAKIRSLAGQARALDAALPEVGILTLWQSDLFVLSSEMLSPAMGSGVGPSSQAQPVRTHTAPREKKKQCHSEEGRGPDRALPKAPQLPEGDEVWAHCVQFKRTSPDGLSFTATYWPGNQEIPQTGIFYSFSALSEEGGELSEYEKFSELLPEWLGERFSSPEEAAMFFAPSESNRPEWSPEGLLLRSAGDLPDLSEAEPFFIEGAPQEGVKAPAPPL